VVALTEVKKEDQATLNSLNANFRALFNDNANSRKQWGGGVMGVKANHVTRYRQKLAEKEAAKHRGEASAAVASTA